MSPLLTAAQAAALAHVRRLGEDQAAAARASLAHVGQMSDLGPAFPGDLLDRLRSQARIGVHFHPDRLGPEGETIAAALRATGRYRSQFETQISNGRVDPAPGGARDQWEQRLFGTAYNLPGTQPSERCKYGALDLFQHPDGPAPRFGSCYLILRPEVTQRSTFTYLDSHQDPPQKGTIDAFEAVLAQLFLDAFVDDFALGERALTPPRLAGLLRERLGRPRPDPALGAALRNLNHYIEAQVHGDIDLARDAEVLVLDPSFRGTEVGADLKTLAERCDLELAWHPGFELAVAAVPTDFRGPGMPALAARVAPDGLVTAAALGAAAQAAIRAPAAFAEFGDLPAVLQQLKLLWHVLVRVGGAAGAS